MHAEIIARLREIEAQYGIEILYACESGSRAWGFASPDSDYDVRYIFRYPLSVYLEVRELQDTLEALDGDLDLSGWEIRKAARLLGRSNAALLEWLRAPIIYLQTEGFLDAWQNVARLQSDTAVMHHYRGIARKTVRSKLQEPTRRPKDYLYALRAVLAGIWVRDGHGPAPVPFAQLLERAPAEIMVDVEELLNLKARTSEAHRIAPIDRLDSFLSSSLDRLEEDADDLRAEGPTEVALNGLIRSAHFRTVSAKSFTIARIRRPDRLLLDVTAGSHAYGTATDDSDIDRRGIFVAPPGHALGLDGVEQVSDDKNDEVYYEVGRFIDLALKSNPNALELLAVPDDCRRFSHPLMELLTPEIFLSRQCGRTFGQYAMGQIRKARGLNKKIVNPQPKARKTAEEFCFIVQGQGSIPLKSWLAAEEIAAEQCGLTAVPKARDLYTVYVSEDSTTYDGIFSPKNPDALVFSSVAPDATPRAWMSFQRDAFKAHCKAHREYWEWVDERNEARFATNVEHGRGYDSKNLMHTFRLLHMALEIAQEEKLLVRRPDREFLMQIRAGAFPYKELVERAEALLAQVEEAFASSDLPEAPDGKRAREALIEIRVRFPG